MRKYIFGIMLIILTVNLVACTRSNSDKKDEVTSNSITIADYFPFQADIQMVYKGEGNEYASYQTYTDYSSNNRIQTRTNNGGTEIVKVYELKEGKLTLLLSKGECQYREDFTKADYTGGDILIQEPIEIGTKWNVSDGGSRYISGIDVTVDTELGSYKALEITTDYPTSKNVDYYAPGIGLVKSVFTSKEADGAQVTSTLKEINKDTPLVQNILFYYPDNQLNTMYFVNKEVSFATNDITRKRLAEAYKELPTTNIVRVLTTDTLINSLYLNKEGLLTMDMSGNFITEMNAGSGYEALILKCLTATMGNYYGVDKVYLTVDNEPYSSGHIQMDKGEYFTVETLDAKPIP